MRKERVTKEPLAQAPYKSIALPESIGYSMPQAHFDLRDRGYAQEDFASAATDRELIIKNPNLPEFECLRDGNKHYFLQNIYSGLVYGLRFEKNKLCAFAVFQEKSWEQDDRIVLKGNAVASQLSTRNQKKN